MGSGQHRSGSPTCMNASSSGALFLCRDSFRDVAVGWKGSLLRQKGYWLLWLPSLKKRIWTRPEFLWVYCPSHIFGLHPQTLNVIAPRLVMDMEDLICFRRLRWGFIIKILWPYGTQMTSTPFLLLFIWFHKNHICNTSKNEMCTSL